MRKSWAVFRRDVSRLVTVRKSWIIVVGVLIVPALYSWFNINAFWDPYGNTANIRVAVVNLDEGASSELTGNVDVGAQVVSELQQDDQLGWEFMSAADADDAVARGDAYAAIVIPADFSRDLLTITTGTFTQPSLRYTVSEKGSPIAPKITDTGATELDRKITETFVEQVITAATNALKDAGIDVDDRLDQAQNDTLRAFDDAAATVASARESIAGLLPGVQSARDGISGARGTLADVGTTLGDVQTAIAQAQSIAAQAQTQVVALTDALTSAYVDGATKLADAASMAHASIARVTGALERAGTSVDAAITDLTTVVEANAQILAQLQDLVDNAGLDPAVASQLQTVIASLQERNATDRQLLDDLQHLNDTTGDALRSIDDASAALETATQNAAQAATALRSALTGTVPALTSAMTSLSSSAGALAAALQAQQVQIAQADQLLVGLDTQLAATTTALGQLDANLGSIGSGLQSARADVSALGAAVTLSGLDTVTGLDPAAIASFVASPVQLQDEVVYPISSYGSAMAALFTNLSLWIGAFMLMTIFKTEVDTSGVAPIGVRQAYVGRFALFAVLATLQAIIVCVGNLIIGVQTVNPLAFVGTGVATALAYVSIVYAVCVAFGHVGRGLCMVLVIMQIPGASGLYPIELMPGFFRAIYPFLPFTYGIDALRETIGGFYGAHYWQYLGVLAVFVVLAFVVGITLRRRLAQLNRAFNKQIAETDLLVGEDVQVTGTGYRLSHIIHALSDRAEYRSDLARRALPFTRRYPLLIKLTLLIGLAGLVLLSVIAMIFPEGRATLLGTWVAWCLLVIAALVVLAYIRESFQLAGEVANLDDAHLRQAMLAGSVHAHQADQVDVVEAAGTPTTRPLPTAVLTRPDGDAPAATAPHDGAEALERLLAAGDEPERGDLPEPASGESATADEQAVLPDDATAPGEPASLSAADPSVSENGDVPAADDATAQADGTAPTSDPGAADRDGGAA